MTHKSLRNTVGIASLTALALTMVACGGSSSSTPAATTPTNNAPTTPQITSGPTAATTKHTYTYNLFSTDADGDAITFSVVSGADATISGSVLTFKPTTAGSATLTVKATDSKGAASAANGSITIAVQADQSPQFVTQANQVILNPTSASQVPSSSTLSVVAVDQDGDVVSYALSGTNNAVDNLGNVVSGASAAIAGNVVSFTGTIPSGATSMTFNFSVTATGAVAHGTATPTTQAFTAIFSNNNLPPVIQTTSLPSVPQNHGLAAYQLLGTDNTLPNANGWTLVSGPSGMTVSAAGVMTWPRASNTSVAGASLPVTVRLTDLGGLSTTATFNLNIAVDTKPNFVTQTYTETVGGVQFFDPSRVRQQVDSRLKFNWLDQEATSSEYLSDTANNLKGWRAVTAATDAENDTVAYSVKANSIFRHGVPFTVGSAFSPLPTVDTTTGEIKWTPNRKRFNNGAGPGDLSLAATLLHDYSPNNTASGDSLRNVLDPANWSFTVVAQQKIDGVDTPNQVGETTLTVKVEPNDRPYQGPQNTIWLTGSPTFTEANLLHGVRYNGGSLVSGVGRPSIQEPLAADPDAPVTSKWIWTVGTPGGTNFTNTTARNDYGLFDPNTNALDGHQDAMQVNFGYRNEVSATQDTQGFHLVTGPLSGLVSGTHYPLLDTTNNYPAFDAASSIGNGFYNPWISGASVSPGKIVVSWAPVRIQYTLGRYIGQSAYKFGIVSEDQYGRMNKGEKSVFPIFGTVRMFNSRFVWKGDWDGATAGVDGEFDAVNRGRFTPTGNTETHNNALGDELYVFSYLPVGISAYAGTFNEWVDLSTTSTFGANLFGSSTGAGAISSGYNSILNAPPAPGAGNYYNASASNWGTLDGRNDGNFTSATAYPANPLNTQLNPMLRAAAVIGSFDGMDQTYTQFRGGAPDGTGGNPIQVSVNTTGNFSDNEVLAKVVPSNSPYNFSLNSASEFGYDDDFNYDGGTAFFGSTHDDDGFNWYRFVGVPRQGNDHDGSAGPNRWFAGKVQSEVNYNQILPGRAILFSDSDPGGSNPIVGDNNTTRGVGLGQWNVQGPRLRVSFTWPTIVTNSGTGYPASGIANVFQESDIIQVATPNMSGNARFFFTGNYPAGTGAFAMTPVPNANGAERGDDIMGHPNAFGKFGIPAPLAVPADVDHHGVDVLPVAAGKVITPIHAVTNSIWIPNNADFRFNFPNAYSTPAGGSGYTDIPFTGIRGFANPGHNGLYVPAVAGKSGLTGIVGSAENILSRSENFARLNVGTSTDFSTTGQQYDEPANPALLAVGDDVLADRTFFLWMKMDPAFNAYGTYGGSMMYAPAGTTTVTAKGGRTTLPGFAMDFGTLTDTHAQISFAELNGQLGAANQPIAASTTGITSWKRNEFELLRSVVGAPAQFTLAARVKLVDPSIGITSARGDEFDSGTSFDMAAVNTTDGILQNSIVVYAIKDRGTKTAMNGATYSNKLGEAGLEPGAPVLAQWWNTGNGDTSTLPGVLNNYANQWVPAEFTEVVHVNHNFVSKIQAPGTEATPDSLVQKVYGQIGLIAPAKHTLLTNIKPVVTPVRQLALHDLRNNRADGGLDIGTQLDIFNGNAVDPVTGAPSALAPDYKLVNGNATADWTLNGYSNLQLTFQPAVNDLRHPSGYIVTVYHVDADNNISGTADLDTYAEPIAEFRMGHIGGIGASQTLNMPDLSSLTRARFGLPANGTRRFYAIKVRNVWMEGTEGAAGHSFDMGKEPWATRFPTAYADCISGVFVGRF